MAKSFEALVSRTTTARVREKGKQRAQKYLAGMLLSELRKVRGMRQRDLAAALNVKQPSLSKLESQADMQISTLQRLVAALGGTLTVSVEFPEGRARLTQFDLPSKMKNGGKVRRPSRRAA